MTYMILNESDVANIRFEDICQTSAEKLTRNRDGTKVMIKFRGETPSWLEGKPTKTRREIIDLLQDFDGDWMPDGVKEVILATT